MTKTLIDVDDDLLAEAGKILGTSTKKDTVNQALDEIVKRQRREELIEWLTSEDAPDLLDPAIRRDAWR